MVVDSGELVANSWQIKSLGDICENLDSQRVPITKSQRKSGSIPYYGASGIVDYVDDYLFNEDLLLVSEDGANLLARTYPIAFSISGKSWVNNHAHVLKFANRSTQTFVEYYLNSISLESYISGAAQPKLNQRKLNSIPVPLPPLPEQKRIVAILDKAFEGIDRAIANTEKNLANAREIFESYLNAVFTQKGDGWVETKLGKLCHKVEYGTSSKSQAQGDIPVLRMGNIQNGLIDWSNLVYTSNQDEIDKYILEYNDVLFNRTNSEEHVGKSAIYKGEQPAIFAGYLIRVHRKPELLDADFLNFYLNSHIAREYGKTVMSRSVNQANINGTKLKSYPISVPPLEKQKEIARRLNNLIPEVQSLEAIYQRKLEALQELKQSILHKAFTGELTNPERSRRVNPTIKEAAA